MNAGARQIGTRACLLVLAILSLALVIRMAGIAVESFWVDEAFSVWASEGTSAEIAERNARDIHPPAYYLGLHAWRSLITDTDVAIRAYSTVWSLLGICLLMLFARDLFGSRVALFAGLFAAVNPLDVYYAQEARMYAQTTTLGLAASFALWRWCQASRRAEGLAGWWPWALAHVGFATLLLLTHYVAVTFLVGQGIFALAFFLLRRDRLSAVGYGLSGLAVGLAFLPWLLYVLSFRDSIVRPEGLEWMPFPGVVDYFSFMGREYFWGRVSKTHDQWWIPTMLVALVVLALPAVKRLRTHTSLSDLEGRVFLIAHLVAPLVVCALVCFSYQVIYYRPRYVVILLPYFLCLLAWSCSTLDRRWLRAGAAGCLAFLMLTGTWLQHHTPQKRPWRETAAAWPDVQAPAFYVILPDFHQRSLSHYLGGRIRHTPLDLLAKLGPLPKGAHIWVSNWPEDLAAKDSQYRDWLEEVGPARNLLLPSYYSITQVEPQGGDIWPEFAGERFRAWYRPFDIAGELSGFSDARHFAQLEIDREGRVSRHAKGEAWLRLEGVAAGEEVVLNARASKDANFDFYLKRGPTPRGLFSGEPVLDRSPPRDSPGEVHMSAPAGSESLWIGWKRAQLSIGNDAGLEITWLGIVANVDDSKSLARGR